MGKQNNFYRASVQSVNIKDNIQIGEVDSLGLVSGLTVPWSTRLTPGPAHTSRSIYPGRVRHSTPEWALPAGGPAPRGASPGGLPAHRDPLQGRRQEDCIRRQDSYQDVASLPAEPLYGPHFRYNIGCEHYVVSMFTALQYCGSASGIRIHEAN